METHPLPENEHQPPFVPHPDRADRVVRRLMRLVDWSEEDYSCEAVFVLLDEYVEMAARGEDVSALMPLIKRHLELCPSCEDEYEALLVIIKNVGE